MPLGHESRQDMSRPLARHVAISERLFILTGAQRAHVRPTSDYASARTRGRSVTTTS